MTDDLSELEAACRAATPGPWHAESHNHISWVDDSNENAVIHWSGFDASWHVHTQDSNNAAFIAAANPSTVLSLIAAVRAGRAAQLLCMKHGEFDYVQTRWATQDAEISSALKAAIAALSREVVG